MGNPAKFQLLFLAWLVISPVGHAKSTILPACAEDYALAVGPNGEGQGKTPVSTRSANPDHPSQFPQPRLPRSAITNASQARANGYTRRHIRQWLPEPNIQHVKDLGFKVIRERFSQGGEGYASLVREPETDKLWVLKESIDGGVIEGEAATFERANGKESHWIGEAKKKENADDPEAWAPPEIRSQRLFPLAKILELEKAPEQPDLLLELFPNEPGGKTPALTLQQRLNYSRDPVLSDPKLREKIVIQLLLANQRLHRAGIIHRDLKPSNILVNSRGEIQIIDFGYSEMDGNRYYGYFEDEGIPRVSGTPNYMSEEQISGAKGSVRQDGFATRKILLEVLSFGKGDRFMSERKFAPGKNPKHFAMAPEGEDINPRLAAAIWCPEAKTDKELIRNVTYALKMEPKAFERWFVAHLLNLQSDSPASLPHPYADVAAMTIGGSHYLIEHFPEGLTPAERDRVIRSMLRMSVRAKVLRDRGGIPIEGEGDSAYLLYGSFFERLKQLQTQEHDKALSLKEYEQQIRDNIKAAKP